ncbi:MAG: iron ABC transporter [Spirochaetaceae bacterium]|nr:MAG: iron ABC transporter [Spirochaetaceae bacterium]
MIWTSLDTWIVVAAAMAGVSSALVGSFLVLKKMSMMGDAISHAVLPGIALAFIITGSRAGGTMFIGAAVIGVVTAVLVEAVRRYGRLEHGAAMGVVFTILFAIGLILLERAAHHVDIHPEHVLFGAVELVPLTVVRIGRFDVPRGVLVLSLVTFMNIAVVTVLFKELKVATFDPALATTLGINANAMHFLVMILVAITTVAAFDVVGSILVIAMLIVPGATAHLVTRRLVPFLCVAVALAILAAAAGHVVAIGVPPLFGFEDTSTAGSMAVVLGLFFFLAFLFAPETGVIARVVNRVRLVFTVATQDVLGLLARARERGLNADEGVETGVIDARGRAGLSVRGLRSVARSPFAARSVVLRVALVLLNARRLVARRAGGFVLTERGAREAQRVLRSHRLWERYFFEDARVSRAELHTAADFLEHYTDEQLSDELEDRIVGPRTDPEGRPIPE